MRTPAWLLLLLAASCSVSSQSTTPPTFPAGGPGTPASNILAPPFEDPPAAPAKVVTSDPDVPSGPAAARDAGLAKQAAGYIDAFTNSNATLSRDGKWVVFSSNRDGTPQLYVADASKPDAPATRLLTTTERIYAATPTKDGKSLVFSSDRGADENWSFSRIDWDGKNLVELTPGEKLSRDELFIPDGNPRMGYFSARKMSDPASTLWELAIAPGSTPKEILSEPSTGFLMDVSRDGKWALWLRYPSRTDNTLLLVDLANGTPKPLFPPKGGGPVKIEDARFAPDGKRVYLATDGGGEQSAIIALDLRTAKETARFNETKFPTAPIVELRVAKKGNRIAANIHAGNHSEIRLLDAKTLEPTVEVVLPLGAGSLGNFDEDGKRLTINWSTPAKPGDVYVVTVATGKVAELRKEIRPTLASQGKIDVSIVEITAHDGLKIPMNVYLPPSAASAGKKLPVIVSYHGGPAGASQIRWSPLTRFFLALGYAWVEPNVRGSSGFGRAYEMADNGPGRLEAFKDIEATGRWAASQSWADKDRVVVYGGSYGGYTVLIALTRTPEIWRAGVNLFGIANMRTFLTSTSGVIREIFKVEFGDLDKDIAFLDSISPIADVEKIVDPLFVYAGANDPRVPQPESDQIVKALRERGVPVEYMVSTNEGHSLARRENQIEFYSRVARFLESQLK